MTAGQVQTNDRSMVGFHPSGRPNQHHTCPKLRRVTGSNAAGTLPAVSVLRATAAVGAERVLG